MSKRKAIPKKTRFNVFKRDKFKCQYCAPDIILNIDHIKPVSKGGTSRITNLITSCFDCNSGKKDTLLSDDSQVKKQKKQLDLLQERRDQLDMMMQWHEGVSDIEAVEADKAGEYFERNIDDCHVNHNGKSILKKLIKKYGLKHVLNAIDIAKEGYLDWKKDSPTKESREKAFNKIGGILKLEEVGKEKPYMKEIFYKRGIIRNRMSDQNGYFCNWKALQLLEDAYLVCNNLPLLNRICLSASNWSIFQDDLEDIIHSEQP